MKSASIAFLALSSFYFLAGPRTDAQSTDKDEEGVEFLAQGPIHEAFAAPSIRRQGPAKIVPKQPPEPVSEIPAEQKPDGVDVEWISGYWFWDPQAENFIWVSGIWRDAPPNHDWVPGYWEQAEAGWRWVSGYWSANAEVQLLPVPPDPIEEAVPPAPENAGAYIPGNWVYTQNDYSWRPGYWINYRPGWTYTSAQYVWTPAGYVFVDGYWDYDLSHRGLLFAPAYINPNVYGRPGWTYRPTYAMVGNSLLANLFIGLGSNHYYSGNYYGPRYANMGFYPWATWTSGNRYYDPLYGYYRWNNRNDPRWEENMRANFTARQQGKAPLPPRTIAELRKGARNDSFPAFASLNEMKDVKLSPVSKTQIEKFTKQAQQNRNASLARRKSETQIVKTDSPLKTGKPATMQRDFVPTTTRTKLAGEKAPPPPPTVPATTKDKAPPTKTIDKKPPVETKPPDKKPIDTKPPDKKPPVETKPPDKKPIDTKPPDKKPPMKVDPKPKPKGERTEAIPQPPRPPIQIEPRPNPRSERPPADKPPPRKKD